MVFHIQKRQPRFIILPQYSRLTTVLALIVYTLVIHPESPERNDVALGELDVIFHYMRQRYFQSAFALSFCRLLRRCISL